jgi:hypothetical protein
LPHSGRAKLKVPKVLNSTEDAHMNIFEADEHLQGNLAGARFDPTRTMPLRLRRTSSHALDHHRRDTS